MQGLTCLALAILGAVAPVDDVATNLDGKVPTDGAGLRSQGVGGANQLACSGNHSIALPHLQAGGQHPINYLMVSSCKAYARCTPTEEVRHLKQQVAPCWGRPNSALAVKDKHARGLRLNTFRPRYDGMKPIDGRFVSPQNA